MRFAILLAALLLSVPALAQDAGPDSDGDGIADLFDNCIAQPNARQLDQDGDNAGNACDGDLDNDGKTGGVDWILWRGAYLTQMGDCALAADFDESGRVDWFDYRMLANSLWKQPPGPSAKPYIPGLPSACRP